MPRKLRKLNKTIDIDQPNRMVNLPAVKEELDDNIFYDEEDDAG